MTAVPGQDRRRSRRAGGDRQKNARKRNSRPARPLGAEAGHPTDLPDADVDKPPRQGGFHRPDNGDHTQETLENTSRGSSLGRPGSESRRSYTRAQKDSDARLS